MEEKCCFVVSKTIFLSNLILNDFGTNCVVLFNSCGEVYGRNRLAIDLLAKYKRQNKEKALKDKKLKNLKRSHTRCHPL